MGAAAEPVKVTGQAVLPLLGSRDRGYLSLRVQVSGVGLPWRRVLGRGEGKGVLGDSGWLHQDDTGLQRRPAEMRASGTHSPREPVDTLKLQA